MFHMDAARDDLVKRIMNVEKMVKPQQKKTAIKSSLLSSPKAAQVRMGCDVQRVDCYGNDEVDIHQLVLTVRF